MSLFAAVMNGAFMIILFMQSINEPHVSRAYYVLTLTMHISEVILYSNIVLSRILVNIALLIKAVVTGDSVYLETKTIAMEIKNISTLSLMRYMLSVELVTSYLLNWKETMESIWASMILLCKKSESNSKRTNWCARIFAIPVFVVETFAPIMAIFALLVKVQLMHFVFEGDAWTDWTFMNYLSFLAFLNQVAGLRVLREVEVEALQHFVFSGADATLDFDELLLLDDWWNITVLSAVSNLHLNWFDNMVFWNSLDPQKIQLLLKNHVEPKGDEDGGRTNYDLRQVARESDIILDEYDARVFKILKERHGDSIIL